MIPKIPEVEELKRIKGILKPPEERAKAWHDLIVEMAEIEELAIIASIFDEIKPPKHLNNDLERNGIRNLQDIFKENSGRYAERIEPHISRLEKFIARLSLPLQAWEKYITYYDFVFTAKDIFDQDLKDIQEKVQVEAVKIFSNYTTGDKKKYITDSKSMITPLLFQPPIRTSADHFEREILFNIYSHWDSQKLCLECLELINKLFA